MGRLCRVGQVNLFRTQQVALVKAEIDCGLQHAKLPSACARGNAAPGDISLAGGTRNFVVGEVAPEPIKGFDGIADAGRVCHGWGVFLAV